MDCHCLPIRMAKTETKTVTVTSTCEDTEKIDKSDFAGKNMN